MDRALSCYGQSSFLLWAEPSLSLLLTELELVCTDLCVCVCVRSKEEEQEEKQQIIYLTSEVSCCWDRDEQQVISTWHRRSLAVWTEIIKATSNLLGVGNTCPGACHSDPTRRGISSGSRTAIFASWGVCKNWPLTHSEN